MRFQYNGFKKLRQLYNLHRETEGLKTTVLFQIFYLFILLLLFATLLTFGTGIFWHTKDQTEQRKPTVPPFSPFSTLIVIFILIFTLYSTKFIVAIVWTSWLSVGKLSFKMRDETSLRNPLQAFVHHDRVIIYRDQKSNCPAKPATSNNSRSFKISISEHAHSQLLK